MHSWRKKARDKGQFLPDADAGPEGWSSRDKFAAVIETAAMNAADLSETAHSAAYPPSISRRGGWLANRLTTGTVPALCA